MCVVEWINLWSSKERKKTGPPGPPTSKGRVKEIERERGISKWWRCRGALYRSFMASFWKSWRKKKRETGGAKGGRNDTLRCRNHSQPQAGVHRTVPVAPQRWLPLQGSGIFQHSGHPGHPLPVLLQQPPSTALDSGVYNPSSSCLLFQQCCPLAGPKQEARQKKGSVKWRFSLSTPVVLGRWVAVLALIKIYKITVNLNPKSLACQEFWEILLNFVYLSG